MSGAARITAGNHTVRIAVHEMLLDGKLVSADCLYFDLLGGPLE